METRSVKALSHEQIADLEAQRAGMGLALAAELNRYPGPVHVLELAGPLALTPSQRSRTKTLMHRMKAETIPAGRRIIDLERDLDLLFQEKQATAEAIDEAAARIGAAQGELRAAHLRYHLAMMRVLTPYQIERYAELRAYASVARAHGSQACLPCRSPGGPRPRGDGPGGRSWTSRDETIEV